MELTSFGAPHTPQLPAYHQRQMQRMPIRELPGQAQAWRQARIHRCTQRSQLECSATRTTQTSHSRCRASWVQQGEQPYRGLEHSAQQVKDSAQQVVQHVSDPTGGQISHLLLAYTQLAQVGVRQAGLV